MFKQLTFRSYGAFWPSIDDAKDAQTAGLGGRLASWVASILRQLRMRRAMQSLAALDDRLLRDVGIERSQIEKACRHGRDHPFRVSDMRADILRWS